MGPRTWADALASLPGGVREVSGGCGRGRRAPRLKLRPLPFSSLLLSSVLPSSAFIPVFSLPHPALCPVRCQKGPVSVPWQRQRLAAPAASAVSLHFVSGAQGPGRAGHTRAGTARRLREGMPWAGAGPTPGASLSIPGSLWPAPLTCLGCLVGRKHGGDGGAVVCWRTSGGPPEARRPPRPLCVVAAGGSAWMVVWLLPCISGARA